MFVSIYHCCTETVGPFLVVFSLYCENYDWFVLEFFFEAELYANRLSTIVVIASYIDCSALLFEVGTWFKLLVASG